MTIQGNKSPHSVPNGRVDDLRLRSGEHQEQDEDRSLAHAGDGFVIEPGRSVTRCFNPGAEGTNKVVTGLAGSKSTPTVTVVS
jgi:hypothetical protein